ncbi:hypothetical protein ACNKHV_08190 [Shigella flexneri]
MLATVVGFARGVNACSNQHSRVGVQWRNSDFQRNELAVGLPKQSDGWRWCNLCRCRYVDNATA